MGKQVINRNFFALNGSSKVRVEMYIDIVVKIDNLQLAQLMPTIIENGL